ncbi:MAG: glycogen phosphorylase [Beggiatoa sp. IS2]|nr:MAG: glycogen phosphorylase [Beggiatoa sp. IS2]
MTESAKKRIHLEKGDFLGLDAQSIQEGVRKHLNYTIAKHSVTATDRDWYNALAYTIRDRLTERWMSTIHGQYHHDAKRVYYLSMEFLTGRMLINSVVNMGLYEECCQAIADLGMPPHLIWEVEPEPALGNGGLGRLAACFLDSMATLNLPGFGYSIRYEYGIFRQSINDGYQVEHPDNWLRYNNPWEFPRSEMFYPVRMGGRVVEYTDEKGRKGHDWVDTEEVIATASDIPVPGYGAKTVNNLRLWSAKSTHDFDLRYFNEGNYIKAVEDKNYSENLSKVLYPDDSTELGRELRLRQEYFFVSASIQDIVRRYMSTHDDIRGLPEKVAIQLNDTHPALAIPELLHILVDQYRLSWKDAWETSINTFSYTNHTLLPEALETWSVALFERLLPRHLQIIFEINRLFLRNVSHRYPGDIEVMRRMSLIGEEGEKHVRMAHVAVVGSHKINGVAALHTQLMKSTIFSEFDRFLPGRIVNKTNGITPRRWLHEANRELTNLINEHLGEDWIVDLDQLKKLIPLAEDAEFRARFRKIKQNNKARLASYIHEILDLKVNIDSLFDVQIKRMHEYKRQLLNVLHIITCYNRLRADPNSEKVSRTFIFAGKAAPSYYMAKLIIKLINDIGEVINNDPVVGDRLKVVFIPNYNVSNAVRIIPAANLSEQISTAGTEASGTGNMKLALNGALTIGTLDGANVEIRDEVGADNIFIFGLTADGVQELRQRGYNPWEYYHSSQELRQVLDMIRNGYFSPEDHSRFHPLIDSLTHGGDYYMLLADYTDYIACQDRVDTLYRTPEEWDRKAILNVANMGKFSSDRAVKEYAEEIWGVSPVIQQS